MLDVRKTFFVRFNLVLGSIAIVKKAKEKSNFCYSIVLELQQAHSYAKTHKKTRAVKE